MKYIWEDLPEALNCFTVRNATMVNLNTGKIVRHFSTNTKIVVVQKCVTSNGTYYRTREAAHHYLNYAFEAAAFGLPNEIAPPAHSTAPSKKKITSGTSAPNPAEKQTNAKKAALSKGGEARHHKNFFKKIFRRKNG